MATPKKPTQFDLKVFESMQEPIRIRIERKNRRSNQMEPISLPQTEWSKEDAGNIEQIVLHDLAGGGSYKGQMTGAGGKAMEWVFYYPEEVFPSKIPEGAAGAIGVPQPMQAPQAPPSAQPLGWSPGMYGSPVSPPNRPSIPSYQGQQPQQGIPSQYWPSVYPQAGYPYVPPPMSPWTQQYQPVPASSPRGAGASAETEALRQQLQEARRAADEERHAREREAQAAAFRQQQIEAERKHSEEMRQLREMIAAQKKTSPADDPVIQQMKVQNELLQRQVEEANRKAEQQAAEARHRQEMQTLRESMQAQQNETRQLMAKMGENKSDPMMTTLVEMQRSANDDRREQARVQSELQREASRQAAESPRQMVEMMERLRSAGGMEQVLQSISGSYSGLMDQQRGIMEMMMNMGPDPKMALAEGALAGGKELVERFITGKRDADIAKERTEQVKANERAVSAQAQAQARVYEAQQAAVQASQEIYRDENGNIPAPPPQRDQLTGPEQDEEQPTEEQPVVGEDGLEVQTDEGVLTEQDVFGPAWENVQQLREAVTQGTISPDLVATFLIEAMMVIQKEGHEVPAFSLVLEQRYADLMELLMPAAPSEFMGQCIEMFVKKMDEFGITPGQQQVDLDAPSNGVVATN